MFLLLFSSLTQRKAQKCLLNVCVLVLQVTNVFGISPLLVWLEMTLEKAQICDTYFLSPRSVFEATRGFEHTFSIYLT